MAIDLQAQQNVERIERLMIQVAQLESDVRKLERTTEQLMMMLNAVQQPA